MIKKFKFFEGIVENVYVTSFSGDFNSFRNVWNRVAIRTMGLYQNDRQCVPFYTNRVSFEENIIRFLENEIESNRA